MWYFAWILGTGLAIAFGVLNAMWLELHEDQRDAARPGTAPAAADHRGERH